MSHLYESARLHLTSDFPEELPETAAYTHGGFLLIWLLNNDMIKPHVSERFEDAIERFNDSQINAGQFFEACGGEIRSDMLTTSGNNFALAYLERFYLEDYKTLFQEDFPSHFDVTDNVDHLEVVCEMLDTIHHEWTLDT